MRYIDAPICRVKDDTDDGDCDDVLDNHNFYLTDANMNVTALAGTYAAIIERYTYDPYGKVEIFDASWNSRASSSYDNSILFAGYYRDVESDIYSVRYRNYHPDLGRWLQRDPLGYVDGMSLYEYVSSNPVMYLDPLGLAITGVGINELITTLKNAAASCSKSCNNKDVKARLENALNGLIAKQTKINSVGGKLKKDLNEIQKGLRQAMADYVGLSDAAKNGTTVLKFLEERFDKKLAGEIAGKMSNEFGKFSGVLSKLGTAIDLAEAALSKDPITFVLALGDAATPGPLFNLYGKAYEAAKGFMGNLKYNPGITSRLNAVAGLCELGSKSANTYYNTISAAFE